MIGAQWESPRGRRVVEDSLERNGVTLYLVRTGDNRFRDMLTAEDIAATQTRDAANIAYSAKCAAERESRDAAERARIAADPLEQYLATLPPMAAGRQRKSLCMFMRVDGGPVMTRAAAIQDLFRQGYRARGDRLEPPAGAAAGFYSKRDFTGFGLEFARYIESKESE